MTLEADPAQAGQSYYSKNILPEPRVLVVDDEEASRQSARMILTKSYQVRCADSAEQALDLLAQESFDLVLLDLAMPGMGGLMGLRRIKSSFPGLPVIIMTAYQTVETAIESMKLGACDYLIK